MNDSQSETQNIIASFYDLERQREAEEATYSPVTTSLPSTDAAMLHIIAQRFGRPIEEIAREALASALKEMFAALESSDRKALAKEADDLDAELAKENASHKGISDFTNKAAQWVALDRSLTRQENKLKQKAKKEEEAKPGKDSTVANEEIPEKAAAPEPIKTETQAAKTAADGVEMSPEADDSPQPESVFSMS